MHQTAAHLRFVRLPLQVVQAPVPVPPPNRDIGNLEAQLTFGGIHYVMYGSLVTWQQARALCNSNQMVRPRELVPPDSGCTA